MTVSLHRRPTCRRGEEDWSPGDLARVFFPTCGESTTCWTGRGRVTSGSPASAAAHESVDGFNGTSGRDASRARKLRPLTRAAGEAFSDGVESSESERAVAQPRSALREATRVCCRRARGGRAPTRRRPAVTSAWINRRIVATSASTCCRMSRSKGDGRGTRPLSHATIAGASAGRASGSSATPPPRRAGPRRRQCAA
jgi:hypothetical protein